MNQPGKYHEESVPYDLYIERNILSALIQDNQLIDTAVNFIKSDDFFHSNQHRIIYKAIIKLYAANDSIDLYTLSNSLKEQKSLDEAGGYTYLTEIINEAVSTISLETHLKILTDKYIQRNLIYLSRDIIHKTNDSTDDVRTIMQFAEQKIFDLSNFNVQKGFVSLNELMGETLDTIEKLAAHGKSADKSHMGVPSGFYDLDELIISFQKTDFIVLAARPSMGKTAFALNLAYNAAAQSEMPIAIFSLEMDSKQLVQRLLSSASYVNLKNIRSGHIRSEDIQKLMFVGENLAKAPIYFDDTPGSSILEIRSKARRIVKEKGVKMIIIDYLQLVHAPQIRESRQLEISLISRSLKEMAKELDVPVISLSQLSRAVEQRGGRKKPLLSDLRESGSIEQDADLVMFLYRPEVYGFTVDEDNQPTQDRAEIIIAKHRNGPIDTVKLAFFKRFGKFENLSLRDELQTIGESSDSDMPQAEEAPFL